MIIDITRAGYQQGYQPHTGTGIFHPFFATANAAFRREALLDLVQPDGTGPFDPTCATGEDVDLCIRVADAGHALWYQPSALVTHHHRSTLGGLLRQWFHYGLGHGYLYKKHSARRLLEVYRYGPPHRTEDGLAVVCVLSVPFPVHAMIFLGPYPLLHACLLGLALTWGTWPAAILGLGALGSARSYLRDRWTPGRPTFSLAMMGIQYLADSAYVLGGLLGGLRHGVLYLEVTRGHRPSPAPAPSGAP